jgi:hypothetical protein
MSGKQLHNNNTLWDRNAYNHQGCRQDFPQLNDSKESKDSHSLRHLQSQYNILHLLVRHPFNMILHISQYILRGLMLDTCHSCREALDPAAHNGYGIAPPGDCVFCSNHI